MPLQRLEQGVTLILRLYHRSNGVTDKICDIYQPTYRNGTSYFTTKTHFVGSLVVPDDFSGAATAILACQTQTGVISAIESLFECDARL